MENRSTNSQIEIGVTRQAVTVLHRVLAALSVAFLAGTAVILQRFRDHGAGLQLDPIFVQFLAQTNLAVENVLAAWYSSTLLLAAAVVCLICFLVERWPGPASALRFGWIGLAAILLALSLDELGSLHERQILPPGAIGWLLWLTPFMVAIPGYMLLFAWFRLRRSSRALIYVCVGVLLLATIPVQEFVEVEVMLANAAPGWQRPVSFVVLEEGTELLAMQFLLAGVLRYAIDVLGTRWGNEVVLTATLPGRRVVSALYVAVVGLSLMATYELGRLVPSDLANGRPENWWPSALAFVASVAALPLIAHARRGRERVSYVMLAVLSLLVGAYVGGTVVYDAVRVILAVGIVLASVLAVISLDAVEIRVGAVVWAELALIAVVVPDLLVMRMLLCVASAGLVLGLCLGTSRTPVSSPARVRRRSSRRRPATRRGAGHQSLVADPQRSSGVDARSGTHQSS